MGRTMCCIPLRLTIQAQNRPYALTSRLHNNDSMLGVKTCRAARTCCAGRALALSASQSVRGPGPARRYAGLDTSTCPLAQGK